MTGSDLNLRTQINLPVLPTEPNNVVTKVYLETELENVLTKNDLTT